MPDRITEFTNDGFTFPVLDEGPLDGAAPEATSGNGEIVILLHGFPQTSKSWKPVAARLNDAGYRTLRFDQRGYAPTARPKRRRRPYRSSALVGDVAALIHEVGSPVHLVGHDWGGGRRVGYRRDQALAAEIADCRLRWPSHGLPAVLFQQ